MVLKKLDMRIMSTIEGAVKTNHRSIFFLVGEKARDQVVILHHMLSKAQIKARPSVLWCYKNELGFSCHRMKKLKKLKKQLNSGVKNINEDNHFDVFVMSTKIRFTYYKETHKILGNTFGMAVLQDFEALTPNILARTIETVEGGGCVCILLNHVDNLKQIYTMTMDVHKRYRTQSHSNITPRFNERLFLSLSECGNCLVLDDQLKVLPLSDQTSLSNSNISITTKNNDQKNETELKKIKQSFVDVVPFGMLVNACKTLDQAQALLAFVESLPKINTRQIISLTAGRGRGKSACLGLAVAGAVSYGASNIYITSPDLENVQTLFEFIMKGFKLLEFQEHTDYECISTTANQTNLITRINILREHRQSIQYMEPYNQQLLGIAEVIVIDEAAAIPLNIVKRILDNNPTIYMASTTHGYEGTGRSLSLKLLKQLREQPSSNLTELKLEESIRYASFCPVESWLNKLLCLDDTICGGGALSVSSLGCYTPEKCHLFYINRDTLFSYHKLSERILSDLVSVYVSAHYKNTPNDLQMLADAPAHHLFCLIPPIDNCIKSEELPTILCVIQVCFEGKIPESFMNKSISEGKRLHGDLIPWVISQQFCDNSFGELLGARIVRIATHPNYVNLGYGTKALSILVNHFQSVSSHSNNENRISNTTDENTVSETLKSSSSGSALFVKLDEAPTNKFLLNYIGVSFGITPELFKFWKKNHFLPVYIRQTKNEVTAENTCIMLHQFSGRPNVEDESFVKLYNDDFKRRFIQLLGYNFNNITSSLALSILHRNNSNVEKYTINQNDDNSISNQLQTSLTLNKKELLLFFSNYDIKRLESYSNNQIDIHAIMDLIPKIAQLYFEGKFGTTIKCSMIQLAILVSIGLQYKTIELIEKELNLPKTQLLGLFNRTIKKVINFFNKMYLNEEFSMLSPQVNSNLVNSDDTLESVPKTKSEKKQKLKRSQEKLEA